MLVIVGRMYQPSYEYLAGLLDHALLTPTSTDAELRDGAAVAAAAHHLTQH